MLRLAPSAPPLWRTPSSLQFGPDAVARVDDVTPWQEQVLEALVEGVPDAMLVPLAASHGAPTGEAELFLETIRPALDGMTPRAPSVRLELPPGMHYAEAQTLTAGLRDAGLTVGSPQPGPAGTGGEAVVIVAHRLVAPHQAAHLLADDITHLPIELSGDKVSVGPLVIPGTTACLACLHAHRRDDDPGWPLVAAQLLGRDPTATAPGLLLEAAVLAAHLLRSGAGSRSRSVSISAQSVSRQWHWHRAHPECLCRQGADGSSAPGRHAARSPAGSASAGGRGAHSTETTTSTAFARPA